MLLALARAIYIFHICGRFVLAFQFPVGNYRYRTHGNTGLNARADSGLTNLQAGAPVHYPPAFVFLD
jgi:hypothetical protein